MACKCYELVDGDGRVVVSVEAAGKREALSVAQKILGGMQHSSGYIPYLLTKQHGPLHANETKS